jgi:nitroreductase
MKSVHEALIWRYATQKFDKNKKVSEELVLMILEAGRLSPSSLGLQPWKFILVENPEIKEKIKISGYSQPQITDSSHLIIICYRKNINSAYINKYLKSIVDNRWISLERIFGYKKKILESITTQSEINIRLWSMRQCYIALGVMLQTAAMLEVDACPLEGFIPNEIDKLLELTNTDYASVTMITLGYRSYDDKAANTPKTRFSFDEIVVRK